MAARRRSSYVEIASNPLENRAGSSSMEIGPKVESLAEALPILADELAILISELKNLPDNDARLARIDDMKKSYLFSSDQLLEIMDITPSIKTKLGMINHIGPRLMDPRAKLDEILNVFTYAEQKKEAEGVLKARAQSLVASSSVMNQAPGAIMMGGRGGRGRGAATGRGSPIATGRGAGRAGRGPSIGNQSSDIFRSSSSLSDNAPAVSSEAPPPAPSPTMNMPPPARRPSAKKSEDDLIKSSGLVESTTKRASPNDFIDRASPARSLHDNPSPSLNLVADEISPSKFEDQLKEKGEERHRMSVEKRSNKLDDWMQTMKTKGSSDAVDGAPASAEGAPASASVPANEADDDVFDEDVIRRLKANPKKKRLSQIPLSLDRSELNGFPSFEEQRSFEELAAARPMKDPSNQQSGREVISYDDLQDIVASKNYGSLVKTELEEYLSDEEFKHCFKMAREIFRGLPNWRKQAMKKNFEQLNIPSSLSVRDS